MMTITPNPNVRGPFECTVPRVIKASPERVFKAWTDPVEAAAWLAGGGTVTLQPQLGGLFFIDMVYLEHTYPHYGRYLDVQAGRRLEFTWMSQGTEGMETIVVVTMEPHAEGTSLTVTHRGLQSEASRESHLGGWTEFVDILAGRLAA